MIKCDKPTTSPTLAKYMFLDEPLVFAVREGDIKQVRSLLSRGASADADFKGCPALEAAAESGNVQIVQLLLSHGAHVDVENEETHSTPLQSAKKNGHKAVVILLQKAGATR